MPNLACSETPRCWPKAAAPLVILAVLSILLFACLSISVPHLTQAAPKAPSAAAPVTSWSVHMASEGKLRQSFGGRIMPGRVLFVPPGEPFSVRPEPRSASGRLAELSRSGMWDHNGGELNPPALQSRTDAEPALAQTCRAPQEPGLYTLGWLDCDGQADAGLNFSVVVLTRAEQQTRGGKTFVKVNGKSIGAYLDPAQSPVRRVRENAHLYQVPKYFATLTPETIKLALGEDFELGQLVAFKDYHGPDGKKVYTTERHTDVLALRIELIDKLAKLRQRLREKGVKVTKFWITSGFRTPDYNHSIGGASYSRHCYGDAVDLLIDEDNNKRMDDLNGDGRIDRKDGILIGNACRELELEGAVVPGGIGVYEWNGDDSVRCHVHIDCRGYISRWGQDGAGKYKKMFTWWPKAEFQEDESGE